MIVDYCNVDVVVCRWVKIVVDVEVELIGSVVVCWVVGVGCVVDGCF